MKIYALTIALFAVSFYASADDETWLVMFSFYSVEGNVESAGEHAASDVQSEAESHPEELTAAIPGPLRESGQIKLIAAPSIRTRLDLESTIKIGSEVPVHYFEPVDSAILPKSDDSTPREYKVGDRFIYKTDHVDSGLELKSTLHKNNDGQLELEYAIELKVLKEYDDDKLPPLPIGKPEIVTITGESTMPIFSDNWSVLHFATSKNTRIYMLCKLEGATQQ